MRQSGLYLHVGGGGYNMSWSSDTIRPVPVCCEGVCVCVCVCVGCVCDMSWSSETIRPVPACSLLPAV